METIITIFSPDIVALIKYYVSFLELFISEYVEKDESLLYYVHDNKIKFLLRKDDLDQSSIEILLQVPNAKDLYKKLESLDNENYGILEGAYKVFGQEITFLEAPPGNYFYTIDPDRNKIIFFDKYDERT